MKIMRKLHILLLIMLSAITSSAFESAEIRINRPNGKNETKKVEMKEIQPDVFRVMIPVREIPRDCTTIDVVIFRYAGRLLYGIHPRQGIFQR